MKQDDSLFFQFSLQAWGLNMFLPHISGGIRWTENAVLNRPPVVDQTDDRDGHCAGSAGSCFTRSNGIRVIDANLSLLCFDDILQ